VTSKVVSLLDAFDPSTPELTLTDMARLTGLPVSTTHRLAAELVAWGGLDRTNGAGYRIGMRLRELGALAPRPDTLHQVARPFMQDLREATHEDVHLAVRDGHEARYVATIAGRGPVRTAADPSGRLPLHATGAGKILLAHAPPEVLREVLDTGLHRYTPYTITAPGHLRRALADVRRTGIAYAREEMIWGSLSVAAPVTAADGEVVAALAVERCSGRVDLRRLAPAVRTAALSTSRALQEGARRPAPPRAEQVASRAH
jgi:DNA-binding IclR family transcriptional regulator